MPKKPANPLEAFFGGGDPTAKRRARPWKKALPEGWLTLCGKFPDLNPAQLQFLQSEALWTGYGGSPNCGKSVALMCVIIRDGMTKPGHRSALVRKELAAAERSIIEDLRDYVDAQNREFHFGIVIKNDASTPSIEFPTGAVCLIFGAKDITRVQGGNYGALYLEEATQLTVEQIGMLDRTRRGKTFTYKEDIGKFACRIWWVSNACEGWFKDTIVVPCEEGKLEEAGWGPGECVFVRGRLVDNSVNLQANLKHGNDYMRSLQRSYGVEEATRMAEGDWTSGTGTVWPTLLESSEADPFIKDVIDKAEFEKCFGGPIRHDEVVYFGFDHGINHPCCLLAAVVRDSKFGKFLIVLEEWYEALGDRHERIIAEQARKMMSPATLYRGGQDCRMKVKRGSLSKTPEEREMDPRELLARAGLSLDDMETKDIATGIRTARRALTAHRVKLVRSGTSNLRWEYARFMRAGPKGKPGYEDLPADDQKHDHACDALRYLILWVCAHRLIDIDVDAVSQKELVRVAVEGREEWRRPVPIVAATWDDTFVTDPAALNGVAFGGHSFALDAGLPPPDFARYCRR